MIINGINLDDTRVETIVAEMLRDATFDIIQHHKKFNVEEKPSTLTLKLVFSPTKGMDERFDIGVSQGISYAPKKSFPATLYVKQTRNGSDEEISVVEFDPRQGRMNFDERSEPR